SPCSPLRAMERIRESFTCVWGAQTQVRECAHPTGKKPQELDRGLPKEFTDGRGKAADRANHEIRELMGDYFMEGRGAASLATSAGPRPRPRTQTARRRSRASCSAWSSRRSSREICTLLRQADEQKHARAA